MLKPWSGEFIRLLFIPPCCLFFYFQTAVYLMFKSRQTMCEENDGNYSEADLWVGAPRTTIEGVRLTNSARPVWTNFEVEFTLRRETSWSWMSGLGVGHLKSCLHHSYCYSNALVWSLVGNMLNKLTAIFQMWETTTQEFNYHKSLCLTFTCTTKHFYLIPKNDRRVHWILGGPSLDFDFVTLPSPSGVRISFHDTWSDMQPIVI